MEVHAQKHRALRMVSAKIEDKYADKLSEKSPSGAKQSDGQTAMQIDYDASGNGTVQKNEDKVKALCEPPYAHGSLIRKFLGNTSSESPPNKRPRCTEHSTPSPTHASATTSSEPRRRPAIKLLPRTARGQWVRRAAQRHRHVTGKGKAAGKGKHRTKTNGKRQGQRPQDKDHGKGKQRTTAGKTAKGRPNSTQERNADASGSN